MSAEPQSGDSTSRIPDAASLDLHNPRAPFSAIARCRGLRTVGLLEAVLSLLNEVSYRDLR